MQLALPPAQVSFLLLREKDQPGHPAQELSDHYTFCVLHPGWDEPVTLKPEWAQGVIQKTSVWVTDVSDPQHMASYEGYQHLQWLLCQGPGKWREEDSAPNASGWKRGLLLTILCCRPHVPVSAHRLAAVLLCRNCFCGILLPGWLHCSLLGSFPCRYFSWTTCKVPLETGDRHIILLRLSAAAHI